jgi:hypothetical protein
MENTLEPFTPTAGVGGAGRGIEREMEEEDIWKGRSAKALECGVNNR